MPAATAPAGRLEERRRLWREFVGRLRRRGRLHARSGRRRRQREREWRRSTLSLISHTNVGKTTLARTLLRRDVGDIRDAAHVTDAATGYTLIESPAGDALRLWDTPGFGDSARLLRRLRQSGNPLGWLLTQVWDRFADRPFFSSQLAVRNVRDEADVVLYLVNAAEDPAGAGYLDPEMQILGWTGKPVLVLLNQLGAPRPAAQERADVERWAAHLAGYPWVRGTLAFDAFARCWIQEHALLERIGAALPEERSRAVRAARRRLARAQRGGVPALGRRAGRRTRGGGGRRRAGRDPEARRDGQGLAARPGGRRARRLSASTRRCRRSPGAPMRASAPPPTG